MVYYMGSFYSRGTSLVYFNCSLACESTSGAIAGNFPFLMTRAAKQIIRPKKSWLCTDHDGTSGKSFSVRF